MTGIIYGLASVGALTLLVITVLVFLRAAGKASLEMRADASDMDWRLSITTDQELIAECRRRKLQL